MTWTSCADISFVIMRIIILTISLLLTPILAHAEKIIVVPVSYTRADSGEQVPQAADKIEKTVIEEARDAGFDIVDQSTAKAALEELSECSKISKECLQSLVQKLNADEAIYVKTVDDDQTSYKINVTLASRDGFSDSRTDGFFVVLEWLRGAVALELQKSVTVATVEPAPVKTSPTPETVVPPKTEEPTLSEKSDGHGLSPAPFYIAAAVTGAIFVGWGITDIVVHKKFKDLKDGKVANNNWTSTRDNLKKLQTFDRILLGTAAVGALTTGVLFFMTDFDTKKNADKAKLIPSVTPNGGMLTFQGSF